MCLRCLYSRKKYQSLENSYKGCVCTRALKYQLMSELQGSMRNSGASQMVLVVKNKTQQKKPPINAEDITDMGSIPGLGRSPAGGHSNPLQYSCLVDPTDRGSWQAIARKATKIWIQLK